MLPKTLPDQAAELSKESNDLDWQREILEKDMQVFINPEVISNALRNDIADVREKWLSASKIIGTDVVGPKTGRIVSVKKSGSLNDSDWNTVISIYQQCIVTQKKILEQLNALIATVEIDKYFFPKFSPSEAISGDETPKADPSPAFSSNRTASPCNLPLTKRL